MFEKNVQTSNCTEIILNFFSRSTNKTRSVLNKSCQLENFNRLVTSIVSPLSVRICGTAHNTSLSAGYTELPINSKQIQLTGQWKTLLNYPISEHVHVHVPPFFSLSLKKKKKRKEKKRCGFYCETRIFADSTSCSARNKAIQDKVCRREPQKVNLKVVTWRCAAVAIFAHTGTRDTCIDVSQRVVCRFFFKERRNEHGVRRFHSRFLWNVARETRGERFEIGGVNVYVLRVSAHDLSLKRRRT